MPRHLLTALAVCLVLTTRTTPALADPAPSPAAQAPPAKLALAPIFTDHMVLQRDLKLPVWGHAAPHAAVTVNIAGQTHQTTADDHGAWRITLTPLALTKDPLELRISAGDQSLTLTDILVGDVWLASGQSNMRFTVHDAKDADQEIAAANHPQLRLFQVPDAAADEPVASLSASAAWQPCTPKTVPNFSAVAYYFGRDLHNHLHVPIGLINSSVGATGIQCWTSRDALESSPASRAPTAESFRNPLKEKNPAEYRRTQYFMPARLYNAMIHPLIPFGLRGVIWYQGESNSDHADTYVELTRLLVTDWRTRWSQGDFPFLYVQLAGWEGGQEHWPPFREAQAACLTIENTGMATAIDIGDRTDIHPKNKQTVGERLARVARRVAYQEKIEATGPTLKSAEFRDGQAILTFDHATVLKTKGDAQPKGFELAAADGNYIPAQTKINGNQITLTAEGVREPKAARYDWAGYPKGNLYNTEELPALPFRTETGGRSSR